MSFSTLDLAIALEVAAKHDPDDPKCASIFHVASFYKSKATNQPGHSALTRPEITLNSSPTRSDNELHILC